MIKQNRFFPLLDGLMEVNATTKKKQGYIKVAIPDELIVQLMKRMMNQEMSISNIIIGYQDSEHEDYDIYASRVCKSCKNLNDCRLLKILHMNSNHKDIDTFNCSEWVQQ